MSAVIRIKRHIDEEPLSAFLLSKRQKVEEDQTPTILKFSGTLEKPDDLSEHILKLTKEDAKELITKVPPVSDRLEKSRALQKQMAQDSRFKIVNCTRQVDEDAAASAVTILDVEKTEDEETKTTATATATSTTAAKEDIFVYDVYVPDQNQCIASDNLLDMDDYSVIEYCENSLYMYREHESDYDNESVDSNDENYYQNDYPDEEDGSQGSDDEEAMRRAMSDCDIDLSSEDDYDDEERTGHIHSINADSDDFEDDIDYYNVGRQTRRRKDLLTYGSDNSSYDDEDEPGYSDYSD